jgi:hypothetical protein
MVILSIVICTLNSYLLIKNFSYIKKGGVNGSMCEKLGTLVCMITLDQVKELINQKKSVTLFCLANRITKAELTKILEVFDCYKELVEKDDIPKYVYYLNNLHTKGEKILLFLASSKKSKFIEETLQNCAFNDTYINKFMCGEAALLFESESLDFVCKLKQQLILVEPSLQSSDVVVLPSQGIELRKFDI